MKMVFTFLCCLRIATISLGQRDSEEFSAVQLEDLADSGEEGGENDYDIQQLKFFEKHPVSLNGSFEELREFPLFEALMIENLVRYRTLFGHFISIYELQAVPGFTPDVLRKMEPYLTIGESASSIKFHSQMKKGQTNFIIRPSLNMQNGKDNEREPPNQRFAGGRMGVFLRYRFHYKRNLQYGFTAEKDAGERLFQPGGTLPFDFQSAHFFVRPSGRIKSFAAGDFTVSLGQGLIFWQSQAFKKTSQVLNIKRQGEILKPYHSAGEYLFLRGVASTTKFGRVESTFFVSQRLLSGNLAHDTTLGKVVTSFSTSGLHRTPSELDDRRVVRHRLAGSNIKYHFKRAHLGLNFIFHHFSIPLKKRNEPYNLYALEGARWYNASIDFSGTWKSLHYFGECAADPYGNIAFSAGAIASLHRKVDWALHVRLLDAAFQSINGNAFTEGSSPQNETGAYSAFSYYLSPRWKLDFYADLFASDWIKYRIDAPSAGFQYFFQTTWKPSRQTEIYTRVRIRSKPLNSAAEHKVAYPVNNSTVNWRTHMDHALSRILSVRKRVEIATIRRPDGKMELGSLFYFDILYKSSRRSYSFNTRLLFYDTDSYDTRIYTYENDVLFTSTTPAFSGSGIRWYFNFRWKLHIKALKYSEIMLAARAGCQVYDRSLNNNSANRTDLKLQVLLTPTRP